MGITTEEMNVKLTADGSQFRREIGNAGKKTKDFGETVEKSTDKASDGFNKLKNAIAGLGLVAGLKKTLNLAGELEQNLGGAKAVFGNYAKEMQDMAAGAFSKLGLSQSDYLATANKMGALFKGSGFSAAQSADMTTKAMQRAADVASIMGVDINSAMESVAGAAKGNFTMMDNLGVAINDTTLKLYAQEHGLGKLETTQQKVNAAMQMFLDKTEYAAGNYASENDTFAGAFQTAKAEVENLVAAVGTELLPAATTIIPIVTDVISEIAPVVKDVANGISWVVEGLAQLDSPMTRTVLYVGVATAAFHKMKLAMGGTASGIIMLGTLLTWLIGRYVSTQEAQTDVIEDSMNAAAEGADKAADGVSGLTDNIEEAGKAANRLAGFDEITKLSGGGGSLASKFVTGDDAANIDNAKKSADDLKDALDGISNTKLDFSGFINGWNEFWDLISKGDIEGAFGLVANTIDNMLTSVFGESYTNIKNYWGDVLEVAKSEGIGAAIQKVAGDIDTVLTNVFGEGWTNIRDYWANIINLVENGDLETALGTVAKDIDTMLTNVFGETWTKYSQFMQKVGSGLYEMTNQDTINDNKLRDKYSNTYQELLDTVVSNLKSGMSSVDALAQAEYNILNTSEAWYWYENVLADNNKIGISQVEEWRNNLIESGQMGHDGAGRYRTNELSYPAGASDVASIVQTNSFMGMPSEVPNVNVHFYIDGEEVYGNTRTNITNGMY